MSDYSDNSAIPRSTLIQAWKWLYADCPSEMDHVIQTTSTDPHTSGGMPFDIASSLRSLTDAANAPDTIPKEAVIGELSDLLNELSRQPNAQKLARTIIEQVNQKFALGLDTSQLTSSPMAQAQRTMYQKIEHLENVSSTVRILYSLNPDANPTPLSRQEAAEFALQSGQHILPRIHSAQSGSLYAMSKEEAETFTREITEFVAAHTDNYQSSKSPYKDVAKYTHYSANALRESYNRMLGCGGSQEYQQAVGTFFSRLLDAAITEEKKRSPDLAYARQ